MSAGSEAIITAICFRMIVGGYLSRKVHEEERACSHGGDSNQIYPGLYAALASRDVVPHCSDLFRLVHQYLRLAIRPANWNPEYELDICRRAGQETGSRPGGAGIALNASAGPIATSLRDCELFLSAVASAAPWERDSEVVYGGWEEQGSAGQEGKMLIGVLRSDRVIEPLPGIEVVGIDAPALEECPSIVNEFFTRGGANYMFDLLEKTGEPLIEWLSPRLKRGKIIKMGGLVAIHAHKEALEAEMLKIWTDAKGRRIDAFICPVAPHPVPPIDRWNGVGYTSSFVLLDYPAGTLPIREFTEEDLHDERTGDSEPLDSWDEYNRKLWDKNTMDRRVYLSTTLSIQVVAPRLQERRLLQAMTIIENVVKKRREYPHARL